MEYGGSTYIITNKYHTTLYTGSTIDLCRRLTEHKTRYYQRSFSNRYNIFKLVYFENFFRIEEAREQERYIKGKSRKWKLDLINEFNPEWDDLFDRLEP